MPIIDDIEKDFELLDEWEDRYRYLIELGRGLDPLPDAAHSEANRVKGCASQVWLETRASDDPEPVMTFKGDSDAQIVRGLLAIVLACYSGQPAAVVAARDATPLLARLGLDSHLTPQRSNGVRAMVDRIRRDASVVSRAAGPAA